MSDTEQLARDQWQREQLAKAAAQVARRPDTQGRPKWPRKGRSRARRAAQRAAARS